MSCLTSLIHLHSSLWMSRAMIVTGNSCGRGGTSSETTPAEFVFGPKTSANVFIVFYKRNCLEPSWRTYPARTKSLEQRWEGLICSCLIIWAFLTNAAGVCVRVHVSICPCSKSGITALYDVKGKMVPWAINVFCTGNHGKCGRILNSTL